MRYDAYMDINEPTEQTEQPNQLTKDELDKRVDQEPWPTPLTAGKEDIVNQDMPYKPERSEETKKAFSYLEKLLLEDDADTHHRIAAARTLLDFAHL